jgi:anti-sigma regulatory factor (Ser/Thr protein kinase)
VHSLCLYDATSLSPTVRDVIERTHPHLRSATGARRANSRYQQPWKFAALPAAPDPLEDSQPLIDLADPSPAAARLAVQRIGRGRLPQNSFEDLVVAVNEAVTNVLLHGCRPGRVRMWAANKHVVVHVHDAGHGPRDRLAGLVPPIGDPSSTSGRGLWIMHQLDLDVAFMPDEDGFTLRIRTR